MNHDSTIRYVLTKLVPLSPSPPALCSNEPNTLSVFLFHHPLSTLLLRYPSTLRRVRKTVFWPTQEAKPSFFARGDGGGEPRWIRAGGGGARPIFFFSFQKEATPLLPNPPFLCKVFYWMIWPPHPLPLLPSTLSSPSATNSSMVRSSEFVLAQGHISAHI
jgi:hypothetical protein